MLTPIEGSTTDPSVIIRSIIEWLTSLKQSFVEYKSKPSPELHIYLTEMMTEVTGKYNVLNNIANDEHQEKKSQELKNWMPAIKQFSSLSNDFNINVSNEDVIEGLSYNWVHNSLNSLLFSIINWGMFNWKKENYLDFSTQDDYLYIRFKCALSWIDNDALTAIRQKIISRDVNQDVWIPTNAINNIIEALNSIEWWTLDLIKEEGDFTFRIRMKCEQTKERADVLDDVLSFDD